MLLIVLRHGFFLFWKEHCQANKEASFYSLVRKKRNDLPSIVQCTVHNNIFSQGLCLFIQLAVHTHQPSYRPCHHTDQNRSTISRGALLSSSRFKLQLGPWIRILMALVPSVLCAAPYC